MKKNITIPGSDILQLIKELTEVRNKEEVALRISKVVLSNIKELSVVLTKIKKELKMDSPNYVIEFEKQRLEIISKYAVKDKDGNVVYETPTSIKVINSNQCGIEISELEKNNQEVIKFYEERKSHEEKVLSKKYKIKLILLKGKLFDDIITTPISVQTIVNYLT